MPIAATDVKLYESQRLTDESDGGGRATGRVVLDGLINNLFPDISRLDRTIGDVALRKGFVGIDTNNADTYLGGHAILTKPAGDPLVEVLIFDAGTESDTRVVAQDRIESYSVKGASAQFELLGNQYENQRQIVVVQREEIEIPSIGDVYLLEDQGNAQYLRITEIEEALTTFSYLSGSTYVDFERRRMVLKVSSPLKVTFRGGEATPSGTTGPKSEVFTTEVADAARYWGIKKTKLAAAIGDLVISVDGIFSALVPSAQSEQPLLDQALGFDKLTVVEAAGFDYTQALVGLYTSTTQIQVFLNRGAVRGSVALTLGGSTYTDVGTGKLARATGAFPFAELEIDYDTGAIFGPRDSGVGTLGDTMTGSATYRPGAAFTGRSVTANQDVNISNRGYNWVSSFAEEKPRPGSMVISYMAQGDWYEIRDRGDGQLEGSGSGSITFATGSVLVTLLALPDVGTSLIYSFVMDIEEEYESHDGPVPGALPDVLIQLEEAVVPGTLVLTYESDSVVQTVNDDSNGGLTGDGTGTIDYGSGLVTLKPVTLHDDGSGFNSSYNSGSAKSEGAEIGWNETTGEISGVLDFPPIMAGSINMVVAIVDSENGASRPNYVNVIDNGSGGWSGGYAGSINYADGTWNLIHKTTRSVERIRHINTFAGSSGGGGSGSVLPPASAQRRIITDTVLASVYAAATTSLRYREAADSAVPQILAGFNPDSLVLHLIEGSDDIIIEGSVMFSFAGEIYFDRDGILYKQLDSKTGAGTAVGSINYSDRTATLDTWLGGSDPGLTIHSALTASTSVLASSIIFRTPGAPIRPTSLTITTTNADGDLITATADLNGDFAENGVHGWVNYETGVVQIRFTDDVNDGTGDSDFGVMPNGRYNAVLFSFLPLDAELIGLDPVRLPGDGRVPIYREGDVIVIHHTQTTVIGTPTDGQIIDVGRDNIAQALVYDSLGKAMDPGEYVVDKLNGTVTFENPVTLQDFETNPLTTPLEIRDRIEHMTVANDVEITGEISFISPLAHEFPAGETYVSSALLWGDLNSRVFSLFTQKVWNSGDPNWTEERIGDDTTAQYDNITYPLEYANNGAITEKWALWFYSSTAFFIVGEERGVIGSGNTSIDNAPVNPNTGNPYFVIRQGGWGSGWSTNNVVRFNTDGCLGPIWLVRTVLSGTATVEDDDFTLQLRGDAD